MRRVLLRQAVADVRSRPLQMLLLVAIVTVATVGVVAGLGQRESVARRWDAAFRRANGAHVALYGDDAALRRAATDRAVVQSAGPAAVTEVRLTSGDRSVDDVDARAATTRPIVGTPLLTRGRWLRTGATGELVIERSLAIDSGIAVGDDVVVRGRGGTFDAHVVGEALDLLDCPVPQCDSATVWVAPAAIDALAPLPDQRGSMLLVRLADPATVGAFQSRMQSELGTGLSHSLDWEDTRGDALVTNEFFGAFLAAFGGFLLIAAALVLASAVSGRVVDGYREIGLLKAVGMTPRAITSLFLIEHIAMAAIGVVAGTALAAVVAPSLELDLGRILGGGGSSIALGTVAVAAVLVALAVMGATILPAWRAGRIPASQALTSGTGTAGRRPARLAALAARARLGPSVAVGLKDVGARPLRTWLAIATLALTAVAVVVTMSFQSTVDRVTADTALVGDPYDVGVAPVTTPGPEVARILDADPRVESWFTATSRRAAVGDVTFQLRALGGDVARSGFVVREGRMPTAADEAIAGYGWLERTGRHVGDRVRIDTRGGSLDVSIVGWYAESEDSGEIVQVLLPALQSVERDAAPGIYLARVVPGADPGAVADGLSRAAGGGVVVETTEDAADDLSSFGAAFGVFALLLLGVGFANLVATVVLRARERSRDAGILKSLGFTPLQVVIAFAVGAAAVASAAALIGVPAGIALSRLLLDGVGTDTGVGPGLGVLPAWPALVGAGVAIVVVAAVLGAMGSRRAATVDVARVLVTE